MLNQVVLVGRLVKDLEIKVLDGGKKLCVLTLAVQREFKDYDGEYDVDFIKCELFDSLAESCANYAKKGNMLAVKGRLLVRKHDIELASKSELVVIGTRIVYLSNSQKVSESEL